MITVAGAPLSSADSFTVSGTLILREDAGAGIEQVLVKDRFAATIRSERFEECPEIVEVVLERIERDRLPLFVEAMTCGSDDLRPLDAPIWVTGQRLDPGVPLPGSALLCRDNAACTEAESAAQRVRNEILEKCSEIKSIRGRRDARAAAAVALTTVAAGLIAAASAAFGIPIVGSFVGASLIGLAVGLFYLAAVQALLAWREQQKLEQAEAELAGLRARFTDAAARVDAACPRDCRTVNLEQPEC